MATNDNHTKSLQQLCRVCKRKYKKYSCSDHQEDLEKVFNIDTTTSTSSTVPSHFCKCCYATMQQILVAKEKGHTYNHSVILYDWQPHADECTVCERTASHKTGGRPAKKTRSTQGHLRQPVGGPYQHDSNPLSSTSTSSYGAAKGYRQ